MAMRKLIFLFVGIMAVTVSGCQGPVPTSVAPGVESRTATVNGVELLNAPRHARLRPAGATFRIIDAEGGTIELDGARLIVPPGALSSPVVITMRGRVEGRYQYRFGPNGLQFQVPALLIIEVDPEDGGIVPERVAVAVGSDAGDDWEVVGGTYDPVTRTVSVAVHHFTQYALCQN